MAAGRARLSQRRRLRPGPSGSGPPASSTTTSAAAPGTRRPRSAMPRYSAGRVLQRRTASASGSPSRIRLRSARSMVSTLPARPPSARRTVPPRLKMRCVPRRYSPSGMPAAATASVTQCRRGTARSAARAAPSSTCSKSRISSAEAANASAAPTAPEPAMVQAGHGVVEMGEARGTRGQRRARLGVVADGMADLGADAQAPERGQELARRIDLGRIGGHQDRGRGRQLLQQRQVGRDRERRLRAQRVRADERPLQMGAEDARAGAGLMHGGGNARHGAAQIGGRCGHRGREQRRRAVAGVEPGHAADRVRTLHAIGAMPAMDVQIDEARDDEPVVRRRAGLDRQHLGRAADGARRPSRRGSGSGRRASSGPSAASQPRRISATKS